MSRLPTFLPGCLRNKGFEVEFIREYKVGCQERIAIYATKHNYFTTFQVILRHFTSQDLSVIINLQLFIHFCHFFYPLTKNLNLISLPHGQWGKLYYIFLVNYVEFSSLKQPGNIIISPLGNEGQEISFELPSRE